MTTAEHVEVRDRFFRKTRQAAKLEAMAAGYSRKDAREIAWSMTDEQIEAQAVKTAQETDAEVTPVTFWERLKKFWKNWGPLIKQVVLALIPIIIGALQAKRLHEAMALNTVLPFVPFQDSDTALRDLPFDELRKIFYGEAVTALLEDDEEWGLAGVTEYVVDNPLATREKAEAAIEREKDEFLKDHGHPATMLVVSPATARVVMEWHKVEADPDTVVRYHGELFGLKAIVCIHVRPTPGFFVL